MLKHVVKWGLIIGLANLVWLYVSYYFGLHTSGVMLFQIVPLAWLVITIVGMVMALRSLRRAEPGLTYLRGLGAGVLIAMVSAAIAVLMQIGYYKVIHPEWPDYMVQQTREHFTAEGKNEAEVSEAVEAARQTFTLPVYATQSAIGALVLGTLVAAIAMIFLRKRDDASA